MSFEISDGHWNPAFRPNSNKDRPKPTYVSPASQALRQEPIPQTELQQEDEYVQSSDVYRTTAIENPPVKRVQEINLEQFESLSHQIRYKSKNNGDITKLEQCSGMGNNSNLSHQIQNEEGFKEENTHPIRSPAKHNSTLSFARTVSEEVTWTDDEVDHDWNLQRKDALFGIMEKSGLTDPYSQASIELDAQSHITKNIQVIEKVNENNEQNFGLSCIETSFQNIEDDSNTDTTLSQHQKDVLLIHSQEDKYPEQEIATKSVPANSSAKQPRVLDFLTNYEADDSNFFELVGNLGNTIDNQISKQSNLESASQVVDSIQLEPKDTKIFENESNNKYTQTNPEQTNGAPESTSTMDFLSPPQKQNEINTTRAGNIENYEPASMDEDLVAKWKAAFSEDQANDDFLETDQLLSDSEDLNENQKDQSEVDPAALFGSDDEGFLEDIQENSSCVYVQSTSHPAQKSRIIPSAVGKNSVAGKEDSVYTSRSSSNYGLHAPVNNEIVDPLSKSSYIPQNSNYARFSDTPNTSAVISSFPPKTAVTIPPPPKSTRPDMPKAKSFAQMSKGGYSSPYDLPLEFLPKKRGNLQQTSSGISPQTTVPPPRNSSLYSQPSSVPINLPEGAPSPQTSSDVQPDETSRNPRGGFFEDLPPANNPLTTRSPGPYTPNLTSTFNNPQIISQAKSDSSKTAPAQAQQSPGISHGSFIHQGLVHPERVGPYSSISALNSSAPPPLVHSQTAPTQAHYQVRTKPEFHSGIKKYVPSLKTPLSSTTNIYSYEAQHSSPRASFQNGEDTELTETSHVQLTSHDHNQTAFMHEPPIGPLSTSEESIEYEPVQPSNKKSNQPRIQERSVTLDYKNLPPPSSIAQFQNPTSKNNYSNFTRQNNSSSPEFAPPQRSRTQSPRSTVLGSYHKLAASEKLKRPASVKPIPSELRSFSSRQNNYQNDAIFSPVVAGMATQKIGQNDQVTDQSNDPLKIRKGSVIFAWGSGGTIVTSFPKTMPRYTMNQTAPIMVRSSGEIKTQNIKTMKLIDSLHAKFPGPLKGKAKKKELLTWLTSGIDLLQLNVSSLQTSLLSVEDKRIKERLLLWQILRIFIEHDGILDGKSNVEKAVLDVLSSGLENENGLDTHLYANGVELVENSNSLIEASPESSIRTESVDVATIDEMKKFLLHGEREKAIWEAVDKRLWAHALLMANSVSRDLYKQVAQEFIQKEVKDIGENTQSLAALYEIFAGNFEESIDELVAPSARAGFQMVSTVKGTEPSKDALDGLDRWRETLILVLNNRSAEDHRALTSLGNLLAGYGRVEAAHICFFFAKNHAIFGGIDDPQTSIVLVGSDHLRHPYDFDRDLEPILLSEVFEYGNSLVSSTPTGALNPHLTVYKLQHAKVLAENGLHEKALQYCENIASSITSQTRRSPYHHNLILSELDDLSTRLKQSPKDDSGSWISKPSIDKAKGSVWASFNKFVAGEDNSTLESPSNPSSTIEAGIFARMTRETPTISRTTSSSEIPGHFHGNVSSPIHSTSRYAPSNSYISEFKEPNSASSNGSQPRQSVEIEYEKEKLLDTPVNDKSFEKTRAEKDRETDEAFRRAAEADEKRSKDSAPAKKGWGLAGGLTSWFGGGSKKVQDSNLPNKPIRAKLGEASSFVYDTELKRWVNKKAGTEETDAKRPMPPPPRATQSPRPGNKPSPPTRSNSATVSNVKTDPSIGSEKLEDKITSTASLNTSGSGVSGNVEALRIVSNGSFKPPSRPSTGMSNASSIDDLLGPPTLGRKAGLKAKKKGRGYVDVMSEKAT